MPIIKLTPQFIATSLVCPPEKTRVELCDSEIPGLYIAVRAASPGEGVYYLRWKDANNKTCHTKLGRTTDIDLADARKAARQLRNEIALGANPQTEARAAKAVPTVAEFFEQQYLPFAKPRKRSWRRDEEMYRLRIKETFGNQKLNEVTRKSVQLFHNRLLTVGLMPASADHHLKLMRRAFNLAVEWEILETSPLTKLQLFNPDNRMENYLSPEQLDTLVTVLRTAPPRTVCNVALFLLATGARLNEALRARWDQIDKNTRVWKIPASNSKSKRIRSVPLNDAALEILSQLGTEGEYDNLFINTRTKKPLVNVHKVWGSLRSQAGMEWLRIHDLRHSYASFLVNSGRTLYEVQQILGHSDSKVTERYAHLSTRTLQEAANTASIIIQGAGPKAA
jgi:site-specific recombinase XerD